MDKDELLNKIRNEKSLVEFFNLKTEIVKFIEGKPVKKTTIKKGRKIEEEIKNGD